MVGWRGRYRGPAGAGTPQRTAPGRVRRAAPHPDQVDYRSLACQMYRRLSGGVRGQGARAPRGRARSTPRRPGRPAPRPLDRPGSRGRRRARQSDCSARLARLGLGSHWPAQPPRRSRRLGCGCAPLLASLLRCAPLLASAASSLPATLATLPIPSPCLASQAKPRQGKPRPGRPHRTGPQASASHRSHGSGARLRLRLPHSRGCDCDCDCLAAAKGTGAAGQPPQPPPSPGRTRACTGPARGPPEHLFL